jgi:hypothetical protein
MIGVARGIYSKEGIQGEGAGAWLCDVVCIDSPSVRARLVEGPRHEADRRRRNLCLRLMLLRGMVYVHGSDQS